MTHIYTCMHFQAAKRKAYNSHLGGKNIAIQGNSDERATRYTFAGADREEPINV
jgi:hypothetical protein